MRTLAELAMAYLAAGVVLAGIGYLQHRTDMRRHREALAYHRGPVYPWLILGAAGAVAVLAWPYTACKAAVA